MADRKIPMRTCIACHTAKEKRELIRVVKTPDGEIKLDLTGKLSGRGAYICKSAKCFEKAKKTGAFARAFELNVPDQVYEKLKAESENGEE